MATVLPDTIQHLAQRDWRQRALGYHGFAGFRLEKHRGHNRDPDLIQERLIRAQTRRGGGGRNLFGNAS
jgi:hypothetical protein